MRVCRVGLNYQPYPPMVEHWVSVEVMTVVYGTVSTHWELVTTGDLVV